MDWANLLPQLGIGVVALVVLGLVIKWGLEFVKGMIAKHMSMLDERDKNYRGYVESNNHTMTNLVVEASNSIKKNTEVLGEHLDLLKGIKEHLKKE